jgi:hypothetical protein
MPPTEHNELLPHGLDSASERLRWFRCSTHAEF